MAKKLNTVNVIFFNDATDPSSISEIKSFPDTKAGNEAAEKAFADGLATVFYPDPPFRPIRDPKEQEEILNQALDEGFAEVSTGAIAIVHSS